jgi:hypothetical protein
VVLEQKRKDNNMDINTMLSAAYDAYEKVKMELVAATETIKELTDENQTLKDKLKVPDGGGSSDKTSIDPADIP